MTEATTTSEESAQAFYVGTQQLLCGLAIIVFAAYFWSRSLHWSDFEIIAKAAGGSDLQKVVKTIPLEGTAWSRMDTTLWICAGVVLAINFIYMFFSRVTDQFVPAIANAATGLVLVIVTLYFIISPNGAAGTATETEKLIFTNNVAGGAYVSLAIAFVLVGVGIVQMIVRGRAQRETEAARGE